jgi:hypothetical protein
MAIFLKPKRLITLEKHDNLPFRARRDITKAQPIIQTLLAKKCKQDSSFLFKGLKTPSCIHLV